MWRSPADDRMVQPQVAFVVGLPQVIAVVQPPEQPHVTAVVSEPPATCPSSVVDVRVRTVSVESVSFLLACFFMARFYAPRRLPFVVNVTAPVILALGRTTGTAQASVGTSVIAEAG